MTLDYLDDRLTVTFKGCGWAHSQMMLRMRLKSKQGGGQYMISHSKAKKPANLHLQAFVFFGSPTRNRNRDLRINRKPGSWKTQYFQRFTAKKSIRAINRAIP